MNFKDGQTLISAVLGQVAALGDAKAVSCGNVSLSYTELDRRSEEIARILRANGVRTDVPVAICMERSVDLIVALTAVLRAGGASVPLDPSLPPDRLAFMLDDCAAPVLLTQSSLRGRAGSAPCVIELDDDLEDAPTADWTAPAPDDLAYIIYTSGSTGKPKGVLCHHRGAMNMLADGQKDCPLGPGDRCSWWTSFGFDVSVYEIFSALTTGAELVIVPKEIRMEASRFSNWLHDEQITAAYVPPMMVKELDQWLRHHPGQSRLRRLLTGVEPIEERLLMSIVQAVPELHLINGYGPTEAAVYCTRYHVTPHGDPSRITPIGTPLDGVEVRLLDEQMQPVADGEDGEIYIGGVQVERGYLHCEQLTKSSFLDNPFGEGRLYRSGDRAARLPDGNLVFRGRTDHQVKFMGYRIELGEISSALRLFDEVREAVVVVREDTPGIQRLVAYYTVVEANAPDAEVFRKRLQRSLPVYMVPSLFIRLPALPQTPNGKVDRAALPAPSEQDLLSLRAEEFRPPVSAAERKVAAAFESLLSISRAGLDDHFFSLGGHSLLATQLLSRLGTDLKLQDLYENPTVGALAALLGNAKEVEEIPVAPEQDFYPLTASQQTMWMMHHSDRSGTLSNIPVVFHLTGPLDAAVLERSINEVIRQHDALRMVFSIENGVPVQRPLDDVKVTIPVTDLSQADASERDRRVQEIRAACGAHSFDLGQGPLLYAELVVLGRNRFDLYLTIHHIASDGWGLTLLTLELIRVYEALMDGKPSPLSPPERQYRDVAVWMKNKETRGEFEQQLDYWRQKLCAPRPDLQFAFDRPRPEVSAHQALRRTFNILPALTSQLKALGQQENASLYMVLTAIWQMLLHKDTGSKDIITGTAIANRNHAQLEEVIGTFINAMALRTDFSGAATFHDVLSRVRRTALEAYAHQEVPFATVMEAVGDGSRYPVFRNSLILHNMPQPPDEFSGLTLTHDELGNNTAKMDTLLYFIERDGQLEGQLEYDAELFSAERVDQLVNDFITLAKSVVADATQPVEDYFLRDAQDGLSCFVIGEGSLCLRSVDVLRRSGMSVLGLISPDEENRRWAKEQGIPWHHPKDGFYEILSRQPFDYLFSVVNSFIIKPDVLALPRRAAINYHDSPLPRYAGVHSTAWALINRENNHGVSWHQMVDEVDAGDIFKQKTVPILPEDTSFTLNARCYDTAVEALSELAVELVEGRESSVQQDLTKRTYYPLHQRPVNGGVIDWSAPPEANDALRRALDFGNQPNELGLPKVYLGGDLYLLRSDGQMRTMDGAESDLLFPAIGAPVNWVSNEPDFAEFVDGLQELMEELAPHERFWERRFENFQPLELPEGVDKSRQRFSIDDLPLFVCFLARFCSQEIATVGWRVDTDRPELLASRVPLRLNLSLDKPLYECLGKASGDLDLCRKHKTYTRDLFVRFPSLNEPPDYPIVLSETDVLCSAKVWSHYRAFKRFADVSKPLYEQSILTDTDRRSLAKFQRQTPGFHDLRCIHQLFEEQVRRTPNAIAVDGTDGKLTYAELNRRADSLAIALQKGGVEADLPVGLFVGRSLEMCVGILGILKSGAAYVPLDPDYPADRIEFIIGDTAMPVVVTVSSLAERVSGEERRTVCIDELPEQAEGPAAVAGPFNLAYVFYTSGSTGKPKGVMVEHHNVVNHCRASIQTYGVSQTDRVLQFFSMNFDGSVEELFPAWACGATVVLRADELSSSIVEFERYVTAKKITMVDLPTAYWHEWVRNLRDVPKTLRAVIIGGEKVSAELCRAWLQKVAGRVRLFNTYGPTECTVVSTVHELTGNVGSEVPIGLPIADTALFVADTRGQRVPVGMPGELLIGGEGVARGYLNRPELTAEKFIPNPWGEGNLYRTGDRVSRQPDGSILFVGRVDHQVKIRGFRIEPDEISAVLEQHPDVDQALVMARSDLSNQKELAAYYVAVDGCTPDHSELRAFLSDNLPEYMVPSAFMEMPEFPIAPGGKVDRKALPSPVKNAVRHRENYVPPNTPAEKVLAEIWSAVLGIDEVGIHDNFFDLGGHSLLAIQLVDRVLASGSSLTVAQLFQHPTIEQMANVLDVRSEGEYKSLVCLKKGVEGQPPLFLLHSAPGDLLSYSNLVHHLPPEQPVYGFQSRGLSDPSQVHSSIEEMAAYYVSILMEFYPDGPVLIGGWCFGGYVAMEMAQQLLTQGREVTLLALIDAWAYPPAELRVPFYLHRLRLAKIVGWPVLIRILWKRLKQHFGRDEMADAKKVLEGVQVHTGSLANREEVYRRNRKAALNYTPHYYPATVSIFRSDQISKSLLPDMTMEWGVLSADQNVSLIPGGHRDMLKEPSVHTLAENLATAIEEALT